MSAVQTEFQGIVRAVVTEIGIVTGMAGNTVFKFAIPPESKENPNSRFATTNLKSQN